MNAPLLVIDAHYLCHRAFHTSGHLEWRGQATGVVFGFLKSINLFKDDFGTNRVAFCFEGRKLHRKNVFSEYKQRRHKEQDPEEQRARQNLSDQIDKLRDVYLPRIGFRNIFHHPGYESDDIMAKIAEKVHDDIILITSDMDLLQCLRSNVAIYSPHKDKLLTENWFWKEYKMPPSKWALVKAIAGCKGDGVPGIKGVGEKTALKFVRKELSHSSKAYQDILSPEGRATVRRNRELVELPYNGCPLFRPQEDKVLSRGWGEVCRMLGMKSLAGCK